MLPEIAADVLLFLTRRDLDNACGISKWFDALVAVLRYLSASSAGEKSVFFLEHIADV